MELYDYYRSTASYRVRIALNLKSLKADLNEIHLVNNGGEQFSNEYQSINPQSLVPTLKLDESHHLTQSLAIIEYLDETYPEPTLLPGTALERAAIRSLAQTIACDIHPLNNLRVLTYLKNNLNVSDNEKITWYHYWIKKGFQAIETTLSRVDRSQSVCFGNAITLADIYLIPQVYNAQRFEVAMEDFPLINQINDYCLSLKAFRDASPEATTA